MALEVHRRRGGDLLGLEALQVVDGLLDARHQFTEGLLVRLDRHRLLAGEARGAVAGVVGGGLHLFHEREHVGEQALVDQRGLVVFLVGVEGLGLLEAAKQAIESQMQTDILNLKERYYK